MNYSSDEFLYVVYVSDQVVLSLSKSHLPGCKFPPNPSRSIMLSSFEMRKWGVFPENIRQE